VSRGIALPFSRTFGTRWGGGQPQAPAPSTPGKEPVPIVQDAGWTPGPVWTGVENLVPTGIRSRTAQPVVSRYTAIFSEILKTSSPPLQQTVLLRSVLVSD